MRCDFVDVFVLCWWEASATYVPTLWLLYTCLRLRHVMTASSPIGWNPMTSCKPCHRGCILYVYTCSYRLLIWSNFVDDDSWHARLDTMQVHATDYSWVQRVVDSTCSSDVTRLKRTPRGRCIRSAQMKSNSTATYRQRSARLRNQVSIHWVKLFKYFWSVAESSMVLIKENNFASSAYK